MTTKYPAWSDIQIGTIVLDRHDDRFKLTETTDRGDMIDGRWEPVGHDGESFTMTGLPTDPFGWRIVEPEGDSKAGIGRTVDRLAAQGRSF